MIYARGYSLVGVLFVSGLHRVDSCLKGFFIKSCNVAHKLASFLLDQIPQLSIAREALVESLDGRKSETSLISDCACLLEDAISWLCISQLLDRCTL